MRNKIFIIPSWYPSEVNPMAGTFIREQIWAVSKFNNDIVQFVSTWGHESGHLSFSRPSSIFKSFTWRVRARKRISYLTKNVIELYRPTLSWSNQLPFGGYKCVYDVNRRNFLDAMRLGDGVSLIHAHSVYPAGIIASLLSEEFGVPFIITEHMGPRNPSLLSPNGFIDEISAAYKNALKNVVVSEFLGRKLSELAVPNIAIIPNLVNENAFKLERRIPDRFIYFTLCHMTHVKGVDILLRAIDRISNEPDIEFWIGGDGPNLSQYKGLASELGISHKIRWLGIIDPKDTAGYFQNCDVFVLPSRYETFGVVLAEAIACGKPVISTRCGGPESIVNAGNGILIPKDNVYELSIALREIKANINKFSAKKIREDFLLRFSTKVVSNQIVSLYRSFN